jgi:hypothetical protein
MLSVKEFKEKLMITLSEFLEDCFPLPSVNIKKKKKKNSRINHTAENTT